MGDVELGDLLGTAETTYIDYLKSIEDRWPEYGQFRSYLERHRDPWRGLTGDVHIHDILSDGSRCSSVTIPSKEDNSSIRLLSKALQKYPIGLRSRIVLVELKSYERVDQRVLNILRLTFNIEPLVFWSLIDWQNALPPPHGTLKMGYMILKLIRQFRTASGDISVGKRFWQ